MYLALAICLLCMFLCIWAFVDAVLNQRSLSVSKASAALHCSKAERLGFVWGKILNVTGEGVGDRFSAISSHFA